MDHLEMMRAYWDKRLANPKIIALLIDLAHIYYQIHHMQNPKSTYHYWANVGLNVNSTLILLFVVPSFFSTKFNKYIRFGFMLICLHMAVFQFNITGQKAYE